jgi:glycosyltransferase involved in cell wall biosynthesis/O-antigen/teichoic acid export membrane protein
MRLLSRQNLSGAALLLACLMVANFINFVFNAFLGRQLSYEQFGLLTFYNTILYLAAIVFSAMGNTVNHRTAYLNGRYGAEAGSKFVSFVRRNSYWVAGAVTLAWLLASPLLGRLFHITDLASVILFAPVFMFGMVAGINRGFLQGNLRFMSVAVVVVTEPLLKLLSAAALVFLGHPALVFASIPLSLSASYLISSFLVLRMSGQAGGESEFRFPKRFFAAAVVTSLSSTAFLSLDVVMVKHYLDPVMAGEYSLLSLVGKMVYFLGALLNGFIITFISHDAGEHKNPKQTFNLLFGVVAGLVTCGVLAFGFWGHVTVPLLLGDKVLPILGYLVQYSLGIGFFTLASTIVVYHLARSQYTYSVLSLFLTLGMCLGIMFSHDSIQDVVNVIYYSSFGSLVLVTLLHSVHDNGKFIFANLVSLVEIFRPIPALLPLRSGGKRILVFNWRDLKHAYAGGAEVYVHELAKRWAKDGNQVTLFCGNDGKALHNETIDGVRIIRRGGFYFVYVWAAIYYLTRFRGKFDLILDCQNGIPFFTPLYAHEKIYCLLFHVHQKVFFKYLPKPLAWFAAVLENRAMPYIYRNVKFITISESTKKDMEKIELGANGVDVIFPGVDLNQMRPGPKSPEPSVLYLGRLKAYKSVDVLVRAFQRASGELRGAQLWIAGSGEEEKKLKELADRLGLQNNVKFLGKVSEREKVSLMQRAWVFVNPSMMEGWGITTIEANACGTPVVASDVPGLRDSVHNPHTGFLVPHGDTQQLGEKIHDLLVRQDLRSVMSRNAVEWAKQFNWDLSSQKGLDLFYAN